MKEGAINNYVGALGVNQDCPRQTGMVGHSIIPQSISTGLP